jgi:G protein-coupled receptor 107
VARVILVQVYLLRSTMPFRYVWVSDAAGESATLLFYIMTGLYFRPHAQNPYFAVNDDDIDLQVHCAAVSRM